MDERKNRYCWIAGGILILTAAATAQADTLTGQLGVRLVIGTGCTVSNGSSVGGVNSWGTLDFGNKADLSSAFTGRALGADGANPITITCNTASTPTLTFNGGVNTGAGNLRYMANAANRIAYRLYSDSTFATPIAVAQAINLPNNAGQPFNIYGRVLPEDQAAGTAGLNPAAGTYTDTVVATLTW